MTALRDARLKQALDHAPDAHMAPDARTRAAIRAMAGTEVAEPAVTSVAVPWWKRLLDGYGSDRMPWNTVLATVLLASLVTVMWSNEEVPGARTGDQPIADAPLKARAASPPVAGPASDAAAAATAEQPALAKAASPAPVVAAVPVPAPAAQPKPGGELKKKEAAPAQSARDEPALSQRQEADAPGQSMTEAQSVRREDERQRREERSRSQGAIASSSPAVTAAPSAAAPAAPAPAPAPAPASPPPAVMSQAAPARTATPAPFAAPAAKATQPLADKASANESVATGGAVAGRSAFDADPNGTLLDSWTQARITLDGKTVTVARASSGNFAVLLRDVAARATRSAGASGAVLMRAELLRDGELLGVLEVGESFVRRTVRLQQQELASSGTVTADQVQDLLREARRLASR